MYADESKWYESGRLDQDGVLWYVCDPFPTWYRYDEDGKLIHRREEYDSWNSLAYTTKEWEEIQKDNPTPWKDDA